MSTTDHVPNYGNADTYTATASTAVKPGDCLATVSNGRVAPAGAADGAFAGVAAFAAPSGELVTVRTTGVHPLRCSGSIPAGARVTTAASGTVTVGEPAIGIAQSPSVGGAVRVKLIAPGGGSAGGGGGGGAAWADVHAATEKVTPVDGDDFPLMDSAASWGLKRLTWANLKAAVLSHISSAVATFTNKTLVTPTITGGAINNATINNATGAVRSGGIEAVGSVGSISLLGMASAGVGTDPVAPLHQLVNGLSHLPLWGGTVTATLNGASTPIQDVDAMFAVHSEAALFALTKPSDVLVIEVDHSYRKLYQPIIGLESRSSVSARDITIEAFDGSAWATVGSVKDHPLGLWGVRTSVMSIAKVRFTLTNFKNATTFNIVHLFAFAPWHDRTDGYGGLMTRTGGQVLGSAAKPPQLVAAGADASIPLVVGGKNGADTLTPEGNPYTTMVPMPASATAAGRRGQVAIAADGNSLALCVTTGAAGAALWKRVALNNF